MPKSKCPTKWKKDWGSKAAAEIVAKRLRAQGARRQAPYQCPEGHWHVGNGSVKNYAANLKRRARKRR